MMTKDRPLARAREYYKDHQMKIDLILISVIFLFCVLIMALEAEVTGAIVMVALWCVILVLSDSLILCLAPLLLASVFLTKCYDSYETFIVYKWLAIPLAVAVTVHFLRFHKKPRLGMTFYGLCAVSAALLLGGVGFLSAEDYFRPMILYYTLGLGLGMMAVYAIFAPYVKYERGRPKGLFICLYLMGLLAIVSVAFVYLTKSAEIAEKGIRDLYQARNNISTMLMIAMPVPCYFASRRKWHFISFFAMYGAILLTGSRGGILMGTVEMVVCLTVLCFADRRSRLWYLIFIGTALLFVVFGLKPMLLQLNIVEAEVLEGNTGNIFERLYAFFVTEDEARAQMLKGLADDLRANPIFGKGMGYRGDPKIYAPRKGAMYWYHMWLPQVIGSLGAFGFLAYFSNFFLRLGAVLRRKNLYAVVAGLSYLGLFLMSQVNPGEFCPLPYAMIAVLLFASIDR